MIAARNDSPTAAMCESSYMFIFSIVTSAHLFSETTYPGEGHGTPGVYPRMQRRRGENPRMGCQGRHSHTITLNEQFETLA